MAETKAERTVEERLAELEQLVARAIAEARKHPAGRLVLKVLGIS